jgi:RHS repeat-associated protein
MVTDQNGNVVARHDFAPFGQEIPAGYAGRTSIFGSTTDVEPKFTGQMRDTGTVEDFFNARYFYGQLMRFMSPDPINAGADPTDPQTWNAYSYVRNNPMNATDPSGMFQRPIAAVPAVNVSVDEFDLMSIPVVTQVWNGPQTITPPQAPAAVPEFGNQNGYATSGIVSYTIPGSWGTAQIVSVACELSA